MQYICVPIGACSPACGYKVFPLTGKWFSQIFTRFHGPKAVKDYREHVSKSYQDPKPGKEFYAIKGTNLYIESDSFVTLLGPSGCGVATLSISYYDIGYEASEMAYEILVNGADVSSMEIQYAPEFTKKYNTANCEALGITVPRDYYAIG